MAAKSKWPWGEIRLAVATGLMTMREAAEKWDVPFGTIGARSSREGWFKEGDANKLAEKAPEYADTIANVRKQSQLVTGQSADIANATREELRERIQKTAGRVVAKGLAHAESQDGEYVLAKADKIKSLVDAGGKATGFGDETASGVVVSLNFLADMPDVEPVPISGRVVESPHPEQEGEEAEPDEGEAGDE